MRRIFGRPWLLGVMLACFAILAIVASAVARSGKTMALPTPISDFSFTELLTVPPGIGPSPSPSATPVVSVASIGSSSARKSSSGKKPAPAAQTSGRVNCPSGHVIGEMTDFTVNYAGLNNQDEKEWTITAKGTVLNQTSRPVRNVDVEVTVHTDDAETESGSTSVAGWIGTGSSANWTVQFDYVSPHEPDDKDSSFAVNGWSWGDEFAQCPTQGMTR